MHSITQELAIPELEPMEEYGKKPPQVRETIRLLLDYSDYVT